MDWSPSADGVLEVDLSNIEGADTVVCSGQSVQLVMPEWVDSVFWFAPSNSTLSCIDCPNPIATPLVSTQYYAYVEGFCITDTIKIDVFVYDVDLGPDISICLGEDVQLNADPIYPDVTYNWSGPNLSCTTCPITIVSTPAAGTYEYILEQVAPTCTLYDTILITVFQEPAPISDAE